jgi:hypothetical protein
MENVKAFFHKHPIESALLGTVAIIALYFALRTPASSSGNNGAEAALQNAYFQAEGIQAQSGAAIQVANIQAGRDTAIATLGADVSKSNATTWANENMFNTQSNNQTAVAAYPYQVENNIINSLSDIAGQTQTVAKQSSGFFGIGAGNKVVTSPTPGALSASQYLAELANGLYAHNG